MFKGSFKRSICDEIQDRDLFIILCTTYFMWHALCHVMYVS